MLPLFFGFFTVKYFFSIISHLVFSIISGKQGADSGSAADSIKKEPAIDIAGLCLPLKPQKEKVRIFFHVR